MLNAMFWRSPKNRMLARNALALLLATAPATSTTAESDSQSANSIMPGCNAWIAQLSRGSTALGSNVFLAGECLGIVGTILYFSRDFSYSSAACPPANVTYNQAIEIVTAISMIGRSGFRNDLSISQRKLCTMHGHVSQT